MVKGKENIRDIPWVEKYRPKSLKDIASQTLTVQSLQEFVKKRSFPHLILTGPAGTGKTSAAMAMINDLLGSQNVTQDVILERNASDESRMQDLPAIKNFASHTGIAEQTTFKFVLLDEADNLSNDVQSAFRRIIETAPPTVKFIFMCNYVEHIIDPLISRCAIFRFYPLPQVHFETQLKYIAQCEGVGVEQEILDAIYFISQGDMRQAINLFQMAVALLEDAEGEIRQNQISPATIYEISGFAPLPALKKIYELLEASNLRELLNLVHSLRGVASRGLFRQILVKIIEKKYAFPKREQLLTCLAEYDYRLTLEADPVMQLDGLFAEMIKILGGAN